MLLVISGMFAVTYVILHFYVGVWVCAGFFFVARPVFIVVYKCI